jgi:adenylate kinase family enzyme
MKKVAVFGNAGGGKSTLSRRIAELTRLPLYPIDMMQWRAGGRKVPHDEYLKAHAELLKQDQWVIDGYGCVPSAWERFAVADTLVYVDLPLFIHYRWVIKRLVRSVFVKPEGWPDGSPMWSSSMQAFRVIRLCNRDLTPRYRQLVADAASTKQVHHLRSPAEIKAFVAALKKEHPSSCRTSSSVRAEP